MGTPDLNIGDQESPDISIKIVGAVKTMDIGAHSYGQIKAPGGGRITVGKYCSIAGDVKAFISNDHRVDWISTFPFRNRWMLPDAPYASIAQDPKITVGNDVWIGQHAVLLGGTEICDGAVIGSHSVVHGTIPPYSVVVGNPARLVRYRFTSPQIDELLEIRWWDWPEEKVKQYIPLLCSRNIQEFINKAKGGL